MEIKPFQRQAIRGAQRGEPAITVVRKGGVLLFNTALIARLPQGEKVDVGFGQNEHGAFFFQIGQGDFTVRRKATTAGFGARDLVEALAKAFEIPEGCPRFQLLVPEHATISGWYRLERGRLSPKTSATRRGIQSTQP